MMWSHPGRMCTKSKALPRLWVRFISKGRNALRDNANDKCKPLASSNDSCTQPIDHRERRTDFSISTSLRTIALGNIIDTCMDCVNGKEPSYDGSQVLTQQMGTTKDRSPRQPYDCVVLLGIRDHKRHSQSQENSCG